MKKVFLMIQIIFYLLSNISYANIPVIDSAAIMQMVQEYQQLMSMYEEMQTQTMDLSQLYSDSLKWGSYDFFKYLNGLKKLSSNIERANDIISTDVVQGLKDYNKLYPGYDGIAVRNFGNDFKNRSTSLLKLLSAQIAVANDALANQKDINNSDKSSAAAVANLTLASLSNLNTQISAEIRAANAYRASKTQNDIDKKAELQNFIGGPYKKHDPSKYKTCIGECG